MRTKLVALTTAVAVAVTPLNVAHADESLTENPVVVAVAEGDNTTTTEEEKDTDTTTDTDQTTEDEGLSGGEIAAIVVGVLAVIGAAIGGVVWAVQQRMIPNPLPGIIPNPPAKKAVAKPAPAPRPAPAPAPAPAPRPAPAPAPRPAPAPAPAAAAYQNCTAVWNAIGRPIRSNDPGYHSRLDRDGDGVGCERDPR